MIKPVMTAAALSLALTVGAAAQSVSKTSSIEVTDAWARASAGSAGAAYFEIRNLGDKSDRLVSAKTSASRMASLHTHIMKDNIMRMVRVDGLEIPAGGRVTLRPGGYHLMLMGLAGPLIRGHGYDLSLTFEKAGTMTVELIIMGPGARGPGGHKR